MNPSSESNPRSASFILKKFASLLRLPSFRSSKSDSNSESVKDSASPLDIRALFNFGNPFRVRPMEVTRQWNHAKNGLGITLDDGDDENNDNSLSSHGGILEWFKGNNIAANLPDHSLGHGYDPERLSLRTSESLLTNFSSSTRTDLGDQDINVHSNISPDRDEDLGPPPLIFLGAVSPNSNMSSSFSSFLSASGGNDSSISEVGESSLAENRRRSHPITIGSHGNVPLLSIGDIELMEEYTRVISHGPIQTTTHIFGDQVLRREIRVVGSVDKSIIPGADLPRVGRPAEDMYTYYYPTERYLSYCYRCKNTLSRSKDIFIYRGETAYCCDECREEEIMEEEDRERAGATHYDASSEGSTSSDESDDSGGDIQIFPLSLLLL